MIVELGVVNTHFKYDRDMIKLCEEQIATSTNPSTWAVILTTSRGDPEELPYLCKPI